MECVVVLWYNLGSAYRRPGEITVQITIRCGDHDWISRRLNKNREREKALPQNLTLPWIFSIFAKHFQYMQGVYCRRSLNKYLLDTFTRFPDKK